MLACRSRQRSWLRVAFTSEAWRRRAALPWLITSFLLCASAFAQVRQGVTLDYEADIDADRCPSQETLEQAISARLGFSPFGPESRWTVRARIRPTDDGLTGLIELMDAEGRPRGRRELTSAHDCEALAEAMAIGISVALEPLVPPPDAEPDVAEPVPAPPRQTATNRPQDEVLAREAPVAPGAEEGSSPWWSGSIGAQGVTGTTPGHSLAIAVNVAVGGPRWAAALEGRAEPPSDQVVEDGTLRTSLSSVWLVPCGRSGAWLGCGLLGVGSLQTQGVGVAVARSARAAFAAAGARLAWEQHVSEILFLRLHADVAASLTRTTVTLDGQEQWTSPPFLGCLGGAIGGRL